MILKDNVFCGMANTTTKTTTMLSAIVLKMFTGAANIHTNQTTTIIRSRSTCTATPAVCHGRRNPFIKQDAGHDTRYSFLFCLLWIFENRYDVAHGWPLRVVRKGGERTKWFWICVCVFWLFYASITRFIWLCEEKEGVVLWKWKV